MKYVAKMRLRGSQEYTRVSREYDEEYQAVYWLIKEVEREYGEWSWEFNMQTTRIAASGYEWGSKLLGLVDEVPNQREALTEKLEHLKETIEFDQREVKAIERQLDKLNKTLPTNT